MESTMCSVDVRAPSLAAETVRSAGPAAVRRRKVRCRTSVCGCVVRWVDAVRRKRVATTPPCGTMGGDCEYLGLDLGVVDVGIGVGRSVPEPMHQSSGRYAEYVVGEKGAIWVACAREVIVG